MVSDDRADRLSAFAPPIAVAASQPQPAIATNQAQTASFDVAGLTLELAAADSAATLAVIAIDQRDDYRLDPLTLEQWAAGTARLLGLSAATGPTGCAEFRAPFLMAADGRASIAFESQVTEAGVAHRLLVMGQGGRVAVQRVSAGFLEEIVGAALGASRYCRAGAGTAG